MGMYTEIYVNIDLVEDTPQEVIDLLRCMCCMVSAKHLYDKPCPVDATEIEYGSDRYNEIMRQYPNRFGSLFYNGSFYTPNTSVAELSYDGISNQWSLLGKGDIKNYDDEIEKFFKLIAPYAENNFLGYSRYEENESPILYFKTVPEGEPPIITLGG